MAQWHDLFEEQLKIVKSGPDNQLGFPLYNIAMVWAAAGHIRQANDLLTRLWGYGVIDPREFQNYHDGLRVLWGLSGEQPASIPFDLREVGQIDRDNWDDLFYPGRWSSAFVKQFEQTPWRQLSGQKLFVKAVLMAAEGRKEEAIEAFERVVATDEVAGYDFFHASTCAIVLATGSKNWRKAREFLQYWATGYLKWPQNYMLQSLMKDRGAARLLLEGLLQDTWGLTAPVCGRQLLQVLEALDKRMRGGPALQYEQLSLRELLERISEEAIKSDEVEPPAAAVEARWLGHAPAPEATIAAVEERLGSRLPDEYKDFLRVTNGFYQATCVTPSFLPIEKIGLLKDKIPDLVEIFGSALDGFDAAKAAGFRRSILIGGEREEQQFLLVPPGNGQKEWQYWFFATWVPGTRPELSLRSYLEHVLQLLEQQR